MGEFVRWNLKISCETDIVLRTHLAMRGAIKGDFQSFVEGAVNRAIMLEIANDVQARHASAAQSEIEQLIEQELNEMRRSFWADHRH